MMKPEIIENLQKKRQENKLRNKKNHDRNWKKQKNDIFRLKDEIEKKLKTYKRVRDTNYKSKE